MRSRVWLAASLGVMTFATRGWSQPAADPAVPRALFEEGTKALDKGDWEGACPRFEASFAMKPTVSALLNIAKCHDHAGKLTIAADDYQRALALNEDTASQSRKAELAAYATQALQALKDRTPKLTVFVRDPPPSLSVTRDGVPLPATALGIAIPVDPGEHVVVASAPGRKTDTTRLTLAEKAQTAVSVNLAVDDAPPAAGPRAPAPPVVPPPARTGGHAWAWATGALGVALGGVAVYFAVDGAGANCGGPCAAPVYTQDSVDALNGRRHRDLAAGIALGAAGAVGIAVGAWGVGSTERAPTSALTLHPFASGDHAGLGLQGAF